MKLLTGLIMEFEDKVSALVKELQALKMRAFALEEENEKLRREITELYQDFLPQNTRHKKATKISGEGKVNLARLYDEGFHVCHLHFGQSREEADCLFCMSFLAGNMEEKLEPVEGARNEN